MTFMVDSLKYAFFLLNNNDFGGGGLGGLIRFSTLFSAIKFYLCEQFSYHCNNKNNTKCA